MTHLISFFAGFLACLFCIAITYKSPIALRILDRPNQRSLHTSPIPRIGGIGIATGLVCAVTSYLIVGGSEKHLITSMTLAYGSLLSISLLDDFKPQSPVVRIGVHLGVATLWVVSTLEMQPFSQILLIALVIAWGMNLFNFMDGSDGLAGGMAFIGFAAYSIAAYNADNIFLASMCAGICGAILAFLKFNWPPAKIFLGDSGSVPLGFLAATVGVLGVQSGIWGPLFPAMIFAMFWIDATFTLFLRSFKLKKVWQPHREHWYQKAIRSGTSHRNVLLIHLVCNVIIASLSLAWLWHPAFSSPTMQNLTITSVALIPCFFGIWAEKKFNSKTAASA
jgi:UDP-GlcNAc:undecaprenyl-phosphate/decaprenyl-phosphate GlcNAc-1-phosphate transferase